MTQNSYSELHITAVNWLTGLAPAAAGASVLLLLDAKTPPDLLSGIACLTTFLLLGFVFGTLVQLHTIRSLGFKEAGDLVAASNAARTRSFFQNLMLCALYSAVLLVIVGVFYASYRHSSAESSTSTNWKVVSSGATLPAETIVVADASQTRVLVLQRGSGGAWTTTVYAKTEVEKTRTGSEVGADAK